METIWGPSITCYEGNLESNSRLGMVPPNVVLAIAVFIRDPALAGSFLTYARCEVHCEDVMTKKYEDLVYNFQKWQTNI